MWFVDKGFNIDMPLVKEIFIDATYSIAKLANHLYSLVGQELGYGIPFAFRIMEIHPKEDCRTNQHKGEALECNKHFYHDDVNQIVSCSRRITKYCNEMFSSRWGVTPLVISWCQDNW
jgi:hypothetical protein